MSKQTESLKDKIENFWYYYKLPFIFLLIAAAAVFLFFDFFGQAKTDLNISLTSTGILSEATINFNAAMPNLIDDINGDGEANITISRQFIDENAGSEENREHIDKLNNQLANKGATLYIVDRVNYERLIKKDAFCPLDEFLDVNAYGDRVLYRDNEPLALHLAGSRVLQDMEFINDDLYALLLFRRPGEETDPVRTAEYQNAAKVLAALMVQG